jgi:hypothetical protein
MFIFVTAVAVVTAAGLGFGVGYSTARPGGTEASAAKRPRTPSLIGALDDFNKPDNASSLGSDAAGQAWVPVSGIWSVKDYEAFVRDPAAKSYSIAVLDVHTPTATLQVTMPRVAAAAGLVFRYMNAFNFWTMTASTKFGTWVVQKVVGGKVSTVGHIRSASIANGTVIGVQLSGASISVFVDGKQEQTLTDPALDTATRAGLVGFARVATAARWTDFVAVGQAPTAPASATSVAPNASSSGRT